MRKRRWVRDTGKASNREPSDDADLPRVARSDGGGRPDIERVLHANEETALNPDPFDPVEPEFVADAVVGLGTMRQGVRCGSCRSDERTGPAGGRAEEGIFVSARMPAASI